ncbi:MAG: carbohydrate binding domain-containing protein [Tannerella sp.]|jgi:alpha-L-arabinofuranosidase|nr:carbohydrate binding domain-containing protein [Tannerella sp.]
MKKTIILILSFLFAFQSRIHANEPDSAYLFAYTNGRDNDRIGLLFAWSLDQNKWHSIGNEHSFLKSDYGSWGGAKRLINPVLFRSEEGRWHIVWTLNDSVPSFAYTSSMDLINWKPQSYPIFEQDNNFDMIELGYNSVNNSFFISWASGKKRNEKLYGMTTKDFKTFSPVQEVPEIARVNQREPAIIAGKEEVGTVHRVSWTLIQDLINRAQLAAYQSQIHAETMRDDPTRFANLRPVEATVTVTTESKPISDKLIGVFFEDLNYAADGGLYAELIQNRGFEYSPEDSRQWNSKSFWELKGENASFEIATENPVHENNPHYAVLKIEKPGARLQNGGFDGIVLKANEKYDLSFFVRVLGGNPGRLKIRLTDEDGTVCGETVTSAPPKDWKKLPMVITATKAATKARLEIIPQGAGTVALDMVSLFPQNTFMRRENGLRADLAQTIADMKPRFVRFPGGCLAHGDGLENMYHWKNTVGPLEARIPQRNIWGYHQSVGLGYFEYFRFCADIGAEPIPIVPAGVPCQNSAPHPHNHVAGQQGGIPMCDMDDYVQDVLDLIEWANGDPKKSAWAKKRADAGHPLPFNLKYIGVGNEDLISDVFEERFAMIYHAVHEKHPEITVIGTVGPFSQGSDYDRGWEFAGELGIPIVDEHYYQAPGWFIHNQEFYDRYDRSKSKVYLGEYAAHVAGRANNIETALLEALHLTNVERNADIVVMTSYAPLLAKEGFTQWNPDLIYFDNMEVKPTTGYFTQKLFGNNTGDEYLYSTISLSNNNSEVAKRIGKSVVHDTKTGDVIIKLLNLLPVEVKTRLNTEALHLTATEVMKTVLSGQPDDRTARPVETRASVQELSEMTLPAYSFTILRYK